MKFVYCGYDFMLPAVDRLLAAGHELAGVLSFECDNVFNFNRETLALAKEQSAPVILSQPQDIHIEGFLDRGAQCIFAAGYPHKIPPIDETRARGINLHPSLLPLGRGLMPIPHIILSAPEAAGFTLHKLAPVFDDGDILLRQSFELAPRETVETYAARVALHAPAMIVKIMADLPAYWAKAQPQNRARATKFSPPTDAMRKLDWNAGIGAIDRTARAFGRFGALAEFDGALWVVYHLDGWAEAHAHPPGTLLLRTAREALLAAKDGFVLLKDFQPARL